MDNKNTKATKSKTPFGHGGPMRALGAAEKPKAFKATMVKLSEYMRVYWVRIIIVFVFAIGSTAFTIVGPKILGRVTDSIVDDYLKIKIYDKVIEQLPKDMVLAEGTTGNDILAFMPAKQLEKISEDQLQIFKEVDLSSRPTIHFDAIIDTIYLLLGLYVLSLTFNYVQGWVMSGVSMKVTYQLRKEISQKINRLPLKYFDKNTHGEVLSRITNDVDTVGQTLNQSLTQLITAVTTIFGILIMMLSISPIMTLIALLILPLSMGIISAIIKKSQPLFKKQQDSLGKINGHIEEMYSGHSIMKVFNGEKQSIDKFDNINNTLYESAWKSQFLSGLMMPIMMFVNNLGYVAVAVMGGWYAAQGKISIGDIQAFIQYVQQFNRPISQTAQATTVLQSTAAAAERIFEFLAEGEEKSNLEDSINLDKIEGRIDLENVVFSYKKEEPVINGFTASIKPGQKIAIVGPTGAGKTTIVNLLMRFYDIDSGSIKLDGIDIRKINRDEIRKAFGMVLQDTWLFSGTIRENIAYGKPDATEEEIVNAAKAAQVDHFVNSLPNGYDMMINEESDNISLGEKQLLTIARAMLTNPPMLILDEATSSVDTRTEVLIQKAMENLMKGRTSFVIAHRLSTIKDADLILVMRGGNIIEQGNHDELLKAGGFYAKLYESQFDEIE